MIYIFISWTIPSINQYERLVLLSNSQALNDDNSFCPSLGERQQFDQDFFDHLAELNVEEPAEKTPRGRRGRRSSKAKKINESDTEAKDGEGTSKVKPEKKPRGKKSAKSQPGGSSLTSEGTAETVEPSSVVKKPRRQRKPRGTTNHNG